MLRDAGEVRVRDRVTRPTPADPPFVHTNLFGGAGEVRVWNLLRDAAEPFTAVLSCELSPGGCVGRHVQQEFPEVVIGIDGEGEASVDGVPHRLGSFSAVHLPLGAVLADRESLAGGATPVSDREGAQRLRILSSTAAAISIMVGLMLASIRWDNPWSLLVAVVFLAGCPSDEHDADAGAAMPDASLQDPPSATDQTDAGPPSCPVVQGIFEPVYTLVSGNCGAIENPRAVQFDGGRHGVNRIVERGANASMITTDIVLKGCVVHMTQEVADAMGARQLRIDGPELSIESANRISGSIEFVRYDASAQPACTGMYDATFSKNALSVGDAP